MFTQMKINKIKKLSEHKNFEGILPFCENESAEVRIAAAEGLAEIGTDECNNALIGMLRDHDMSVKIAAVNALGKVKEFVLLHLLHMRWNSPKMRHLLPHVKRL